MALIFLDASVLIAVLDAEDAHHERVLDTLTSEFAEDEWITSTVAAAEVLVGAYRAGGEAGAVAEDLLTTGLDWIAALPFDVAKTAARAIADRPALRLPDAIHVATAEASEANVILTTDRSWRRLSDAVRVL